MAHVMKMTRGAIGHMFKHYERAYDEKGEYIKFGNEDIDITRTYLNYNLAPENKFQGEFVKQRCSEVKCLNRKDVNVACSWIISLPKDFSELNKGKDQREFFEGTYKFLENRYGKDNVISAYVHMDETIPHIHFCFIPVVWDMKKNIYKLSAKEVVNKYDLQTFHNDLQEYLGQTRGLCANILNQATLEGNKSIKELKRGTATRELNKTLVEIEMVKKDVQSLEKDKRALEGQIQSLEGRILTLQEVNQVKIKKPLLGGEKAIIKMPYQYAINLQKTAQKIGEVDSLLQKAEKKFLELQRNQKILEKEREEVRKIPLKDQMERTQLLKENDDLKKQISMINYIMKKRPDLMTELQKETKAISTPRKNRGFDIER